MYTELIIGKTRFKLAVRNNELLEIYAKRFYNEVLCSKSKGKPIEIYFQPNGDEIRICKTETGYSCYYKTKEELQ